MTALPAIHPSADILPALTRAMTFPRLRYMGSQYKLLPHLASVFAEVGGTTALDAFSGSGVVSWAGGEPPRLHPQDIRQHLLQSG